MTASNNRRRVWQATGWTLAALATFAGVFILPYRFPTREPVLSETYTAGANNQAAALALAIVSALVALCCWRWGRPDPRVIPGQPHRPKHLPRLYLAFSILAAVLWTATLGAAVTRAHIYWGDAGYFLNQLRTGLVFHQPLYRGFEFAYGPLLFYWPAAFIRALAPFGVSTTAAYMISLAVMQTLGLALLFFVVQALPLGRGLKATAFVLITFGTLTSLLGLNYSIFRFILPLATIVFLTRRKSLAQAALTAGAGEMLQLAVSPELGLAFAAAALGYSLYRALTAGARWLAVAVAALLGAAIFALLAGRDYFLTLATMGAGAYNLLLLPVPHILVFLVVAAAFAPLAVASALRRADESAGTALGLYLAGLGLLPAALGRCDPIHVFFDGIALYLLAFVALDRAAPRLRALGIAAIAGVFLLTQASNFRLYQYRLQMVAGRVPLAQLEGIDEPQLLAALAGAPVSAPALAPVRIVEDLTRTGQYVPGYFSGWTAVWERNAELRVIADMRRTPFALVAFTDPPTPDPVVGRRIDRAMRLGLAYHPRRPIYTRGALLDAELARNWTPLGIFGDYALFRKRQ